MLKSARHDALLKEHRHADLALVGCSGVSDRLDGIITDARRPRRSLVETCQAHDTEVACT